MTINLPQFTFLCGRLGLGQIPLMKALVEQDDQVIRLDFTYPLHEFLLELFPDSCPAVLDPLENLDRGLLGYPATEASQHDYTEIGSNTIGSFLRTMDEGLRNTFGDGALGLLSTRYIKQAQLTDNFDHLLFTDATNRRDIEIVMREFQHLDNSDFLCIHLGSITEQYKTDTLPCKHIWLAHNETIRRLAQLQKDLTHDRPPGRSAGVSTGT